MTVEDKSKAANAQTETPIVSENIVESPSTEESMAQCSVPLSGNTLYSGNTEPADDNGCVASEPTDPYKIDKDYLVVDPGVPGQEWCVLSFIRPEDLEKKREAFYMHRFLNESVNEYLTSSVRDMARRINADFFKTMEARCEKLMKSKNPNHHVMAKELNKIRKEIECDEDKLAEMCLHKHGTDLETTLAQYDEFKLSKSEDLDKVFDEENGKRTSIMGIKFSGAYPFQEAAAERAKFLAENVEPGVHHYIAQSFHWCPFDPDPNGVKDQRYLNKELNELMKRKQENLALMNHQFNQRKNALVEEANAQRENLRERLRQKYKNRRKR